MHSLETIIKLNNPENSPAPLDSNKLGEQTESKATSSTLPESQEAWSNSSLGHSGYVNSAEVRQHLLAARHAVRDLDRALHVSKYMDTELSCDELDRLYQIFIALGGEYLSLKAQYGLALTDLQEHLFAAIAELSDQTRGCTAQGAQAGNVRVGGHQDD